MTEKILIVEDEFIVANDLRLTLEKAGYQVCGIAASVEEAQQIINVGRPAMVLLDIHLKGKQSGIDLARQLKEQNIAFIYLSANSNQRILEAAKATEPYGFLVKPFRTKDVLVALDIARYRHQHSLETALRQEATLQEKLTAIATQQTTGDQKIRQAAGTLQPLLPFDFITIKKKDSTNTENNWKAYLRIGYDEYQYIGSKELVTITNKEQRVEQENPAGTTPAWYNEQTFEKAIKDDPFKQLMAQTFQLRSLLTKPVKEKDRETYNITLYSRRPDAWHAGHLALLERLQQPLIAILNSLYAGKTNQEIQERTDKKSPGIQAGFEGIIGNSPTLLAVLDLVTQVAPFDTSVLILGESGTGKERIAHSLHYASARKTKPFIKVNCAALPPSLIESELFGHEKGAFTGAMEKRIGKFEQAHEGTIFLDEIGELPLELQVKLLRVLQEKEIERLGGNGPLKINVRIIAATNRQLEKEVAEGRFRLDLYYRLNVFPVTLPPLRERKEDIRLLASHFATLFARQHNKTLPAIAPAMITELEAWNWPGNIRELENVMEQSVILNDGAAPLQLKRPLNTTGRAGETTSLPQNITAAQSLTDIRKIQEETERAYIINILRKANGRIRGEGGAAQLLNIKPTTLESKMQKLGIKKDSL